MTTDRLLAPHAHHSTTYRPGGDALRPALKAATYPIRIPVRLSVLSGGFTVIDAQQRHLHDRAHTLGFTDLHSYLLARCQDHASLARIAGEPDTTIDVIRRLIDEAGIHRSPRPVRSARQRRRTTDQRLTERAAQLGFASLQAYLTDRVTQQGWPLTQVASELGIDENTVRDRLDHHPRAAPYQATAR